MATKKIETLVPRVRKEAPSCPESLAVDELRNTLIEFCISTDIYLQDLTLLQVVKNLNEYSSSDLDIPVGTELNHIIDMMKLLLDASSLTDEQKANFNAMKEYIDEIRDLNNKYKDSYANDPNWDYKTREDVLDEIDDKLAGGMAEEVHSEADVTGLQKLGGRLGA